MGMMANARQIMFDTLYNLLSGLGTSKDKTTGAQYVLTTIDDASLEAAYRGDWLTRKVIDIPAQDATREWRAWQADDHQIEAIEELESRLNILARVQRAMILGRLYGGAGLVLGVKGAGGAESELTLERVGKDSLQFVHAVSRRELSPGPMVTSLMSPWFGRPEYYERNVVDSLPIRIHPSRVIPFIGKPCPDPNSNPAVLGWGDSLLQSIDDALKQTGIVQGSLATLVQESKVDIIRIPELAVNLSTEEYANRLTMRFSYANQIKSITNALLLDKEEDWERVSVNFAGLPDVARLFFIAVSGAADIPATRLLGQSPQGMNSTGESDIRNYYDRLHSDQASELSPTISPLDEVIIRSATGARDPAIHYVWNPLWQMTPVEKADLAKKKADTFTIDLNSGLFSPEVMRRARENQLVEDGTYPGIESAIEEEGEDVIPLIEQEELAIEQQRMALLAPPEAVGDAFDPNQPRDPEGKWSETGESSAIAQPSKFFGKGWWYNTDTGKLHGIEPGALGPHGDHDGWISLGDNAKAIGIDPNRAAAFQVANWGGDPSSPNPKIAEFGKRWDPEKLFNAHSGHGDPEYKAWEQDFQKTFGMHPGEATNFNPSNLVRIRQWKSGELTISTPEQIKSPARFVESLLGQDASMVQGAKTVTVADPDDGNYTQMSLEEFLNAKWKMKKTSDAVNFTRDAEPRTLYVRRDVVNADAIIAWAKSVDISPVPADELHVTIMYSRTPCDWMKIEGADYNQRADGTVLISPGGVRIVEALGAQGAIVLLFTSSTLSWRHEQLKRDAGAVWDYESYQPHVTIAYDSMGLAQADVLRQIEPYRGEIILGPEIFEEIKPFNPENM